jgi:alpha-1,3-rhamnosyltransferase
MIPVRLNNKMNQTINADHPLVSIIVITYNSSRTVLETLESAKAQTYRNIELIISDDCSKDDTVEVCRKWLEENKETFVRTKVITVPANTGIPANCNRGTKAAHGKWVKLIAGDDLLLKNSIKDYLSFVNNNPAAKIITADLEFIDTDSNAVEHKSVSKDGVKNYYFTLPADKQLKTYARTPLFLNTPAFFIEKQALIDIDYFDEEFSIFEDTCLIYRINAKGWKIYYLNIPTVKYRISDSSISRETNEFFANLRNNEQKTIFKKYRHKHLSKTNIIDLSVYYELWLFYYYKGIFGFKLVRILKLFSIHYWYKKYLNVVF